MSEKISSDSLHENTDNESTGKRRKPLQDLLEEESDKELQAGVEGRDEESPDEDKGEDVVDDETSEASEEDVEQFPVKDSEKEQHTLGDKFPGLADIETKEHELPMEVESKEEKAKTLAEEVIEALREDKEEDENTEDTFEEAQEKLKESKTVRKQDAENAELLQKTQEDEEEGKEKANYLNENKGGHPSRQSNKTQAEKRNKDRQPTEQPTNKSIESHEKPRIPESMREALITAGIEEGLVDRFGPDMALDFLNKQRKSGVSELTMEDFPVSSVEEEEFTVKVEKRDTPKPVEHYDSYDSMIEKLLGYGVKHEDLENLSEKNAVALLKSIQNENRNVHPNEDEQPKEYLMPTEMDGPVEKHVSRNHKNNTLDNELLKNDVSERDLDKLGGRQAESLLKSIQKEKQTTSGSTSEQTEETESVLEEETPFNRVDKDKQLAVQVEPEQVEVPIETQEDSGNGKKKVGSDVESGKKDIPPKKSDDIETTANITSDVVEQGKNEVDVDTVDHSVLLRALLCERGVGEDVLNTLDSEEMQTLLDSLQDGEELTMDKDLPEVEASVIGSKQTSRDKKESNNISGNVHKETQNSSNEALEKKYNEIHAQYEEYIEKLSKAEQKFCQAMLAYAAEDNALTPFQHLTSTSLAGKKENVTLAQLEYDELLEAIRSTHEERLEGGSEDDERDVTDYKALKEALLQSAVDRGLVIIEQFKLTKNSADGEVRKRLAQKTVAVQDVYQNMPYDNKISYGAMTVTVNGVEGDGNQFLGIGSTGSIEEKASGESATTPEKIATEKESTEATKKTKKKKTVETLEAEVQADKKKLDKVWESKERNLKNADGIIGSFDKLTKKKRHLKS